MTSNFYFTKEDIVKLKRYTYALKYNIDFNFQNQQKEAFIEVGTYYPVIRNKTNNDVLYEYTRRNILPTFKPISQFDKTDIEIWTACYICNFNEEISAYERKHGVVDLKLSQEFDDYINNRNNSVTSGVIGLCLEFFIGN